MLMSLKLCGVIAVLAAAVTPDLGALDLGAERQRVVSGTRMFVVLASGGVAIVDVTDPAAPKLLGRFAEERAVTHLVVVNDVAYAIETRHEATAWNLSNPSAPVAMALDAPIPPGTAAPPAVTPSTPIEPVTAEPVVVRTADVVEVKAGRVIFAAGTEDGFRPGMHVRVVSQRPEPRPDLTTGQMVQVPSNEVTAVVKIEQAEAHRSMARLGRGDIASPGDRVVVTDEPLSEKLLVPRRAPFRFLAGFHARPFLGLEATTLSGSSSKPFGILLDVYASYYSDSLPLMVSASVAPLGLAIGSGEAHYPATFALTGAYATDYFEIGLGAGALIGNEGPCYPNFPDAGPLAGTCEVNTGWTINQVLRLGALDGIHASWRSSIFSRPDRFVFGVGRAELNVPITRQFGLFGAGGGGENGWGFGEFGVRTWLGGTGASGTTILSASLGYSTLFDGPSHELIGGPSVAFGLEQRL